MRTSTHSLITSIYIGLLVFLAVLASSYILYSEARIALEDDVEEYLSGMAKAAAKQIDGDLHMTFTSRAQESSPQYLSQITELKNIQTASHNIRYIYTCILKNDQVYFILDPTPPDIKAETGVESKSHIMDVYKESDRALMQALREHKVTFNKQPYVDRWGSFVSGYAPFYNRKNEFVGVVGVDISAKDYLAKVSRLHNAEIICIIIGLLISFFTSYLIYRHGARIKKMADHLAAKNKKLIQITASAEEANKMKSEFLATMSHEIRTPMNGVIGMTELLLASKLDAKQQNYAQKALNSAKALLAIINDILDVSKIESGKFQLELVPFDLHQMVQDQVEALMISARKKNIELMLRIMPNTSRYVTGDPTRIGQVMTNFISNAIKFTQHGFVLVIVEEVPHTTRDGHAQFKFSVQDTGIGIPEWAQAKLFEKFTQVDSTTTRKYGGTGLGLAICKQLVGMMNGEIGFVSVESSGSTFWCTVELEIGSKPNMVAVENKPALPLSKSQMRFDGANILLAEDNIVNQEFVVEMLKQMGCKVTVASNGKIAVQKLMDTTYDLVLMDVQMPEMDGIEATQVIKKLMDAEHLPFTPIIAITANALKEDRDLCLQVGMNDYLAKPVLKHALEQMLAKWLRPANVTEAVKAGPGEEEIDAFMLQQVAELMGEDTKAYLTLYLADTAKNIQHLKDKSAVDAPALEAVIYAHSIKSTSQQVGAVRLSALAKQMEAACTELAANQGKFNQLRSELIAMEQAYISIKPILLKWLESLQAPLPRP